jgi:hypothetical protein
MSNHPLFGKESPITSLALSYMNKYERAVCFPESSNIPSPEITLYCASAGWLDALKIFQIDLIHSFLRLDKAAQHGQIRTVKAFLGWLKNQNDYRGYVFSSAASAECITAMRLVHADIINKQQRAGSRSPGRTSAEEGLLIAAGYGKILAMKLCKQLGAQNFTDAIISAAYMEYGLSSSGSIRAMKLLRKWGAWWQGVNYANPTPKAKKLLDKWARDLQRVRNQDA